MQRADSRDSLWGIVREWRRQGHIIALVPTMGNLHAGHLALVKAARASADRVVTSIYVNPTQFGQGEDFGRYPRTLEQDLRKLEAEGCDLAFVPDEATMYPFEGDEAVRVRAAPALASVLEGEHRPGHFDGVVTVVARLFNLVGPDVAVFGEKDYQQLLVIRRLAEDMGYPLRILPVPTVRESGGLAMSSRNQYLGDEDRSAALQLNGVLREAVERLASGVGRERVERDAVARLEGAGFKVDYVAVRRAGNLAIPGDGESELRVLAAARCGNTRLIDNLSTK